MNSGFQFAMWKLILAQTAPTAPAAPAGGTGAPPQGSLLTSMFPMFIAIFAVMYFLMIRPQQKRDKERRKMLESVAKGDKVVTTGGVIGTVVGLSDKSVVLSVDDKVTIEFIRGAIAQVTTREGESKKK
jgi:preprotein translocase subunit YajC